MKAIQINERWIGSGYPCFVIAEAGVNHNGDINLAKQLIDVASEVGADAIKFQTFKADRLVTRDAPKADYQRQTTSTQESQFEMLQRLELSEAAHAELVEYCKKRNLLFMSTPFDEESADLLEDLGVPVYKIPSGEITNIPYLNHVASKGKPLIVSTGMAYLGEVEKTVRTIEATGNSRFVLLHCVSNYPAAPEDINLSAMKTMATAFNVPVGYSDHTEGLEIAFASVAMGACVLEKHFTLDRDLPGPDHRASIEPEQFAALVQGIRAIEAAMGDGRKQPAASEANTASVARKSLVAATDLQAGTVITEEMIAIRRPGTGLLPELYPMLIGRKLTVDVKSGTLFDLSMFS